MRVELPLMIVHDDGRLGRAGREHPTVEAPETTDPALADLTGRRVLLVDDDADALEMARDALSFAGATESSVTSGSARPFSITPGRCPYWASMRVRRSGE